jgi:hypothetical protein
VTAGTAVQCPKMGETTPPYWVLISVLFSSVRLTPSLAMTLHEAAYHLYRTGGGAQEILGDLVSGRVRNLRKSAALGSIAGPAFEADLETERGKGKVHFLLTREGLGIMEAKGRRKSARAELMN